MGILIKGFDVPSTCNKCMLAAWSFDSYGDVDDLVCQLIDEPVDTEACENRKREDCPLIQVNEES